MLHRSSPPAGGIWYSTRPNEWLPLSVADSRQASTILISGRITSRSAPKSRGVGDTNLRKLRAFSEKRDSKGTIGAGALRTGAFFYCSRMAQGRISKYQMNQHVFA